MMLKSNNIIIISRFNIFFDTLKKIINLLYGKVRDAYETLILPISFLQYKLSVFIY